MGAKDASGREKRQDAGGRAGADEARKPRAGGAGAKDTRRRRTADGGGAGGPLATEADETAAAKHKRWKAGALTEALEDGDLALFLSTWDEEDGDAVETAERLGLMASRNEDGGLYMR